MNFNRRCYACNAELEPDGPDTDYQYDNALWITLDGGYGMFVESESFMLVGDFWRSLPEPRRRAAMLDWYESLSFEYDPDSIDIESTPMPLPESLQQEWSEWFEAHRKDKVVICHDCAHEMCEKLPWMKRLINPHKSHSHKTAWKEAHPEHFGWDYDHAS